MAEVTSDGYAGYADPWAEYLVRLTGAVDAMFDGSWIIHDGLTVGSAGAEEYVVRVSGSTPHQERLQPESTLVLEAVPDSQLPEALRRGPAGAAAFTELGWHEPDGTHESWRREVPAADAAAQVRAAMRDVFGVASPADLRHDYVRWEQTPEYWADWAHQDVQDPPAVRGDPEPRTLSPEFEDTFESMLEDADAAMHGRRELGNRLFELGARYRVSLHGMTLPGGEERMLSELMLNLAGASAADIDQARQLRDGRDKFGYALRYLDGQLGLMAGHSVLTEDGYRVLGRWWEPPQHDDPRFWMLDRNTYLIGIGEDGGSVRVTQTRGRYGLFDTGVDDVRELLARDDDFIDELRRQPGLYSALANGTLPVEYTLVAAPDIDRITESSVSPPSSPDGPGEPPVDGPGPGVDPQPPSRGSPGGPGPEHGPGGKTGPQPDPEAPDARAPRPMPASPELRAARAITRRHAPGEPAVRHAPYMPAPARDTRPTGPAR